MIENCGTTGEMPCLYANVFPDCKVKAWKKVQAETGRANFSIEKRITIPMLKKSRGIGVGLAAMFVSLAAFAVTATPGSVSVVSGSYQTVNISNVYGSVSLKNSKPSVMTVSKVSTNTYKVYGVAAGTAVIEFKDRKSTAKVYVTVTAQTTATLSGRLLASNCFQCHGTNGTGGFERLAGNSASEIYNELKEFASGTEDANGIMAAHAMGFSDAELRAIANYFASVR